LFNIDGYLTTTTKKVDLNPFDSGNFMIDIAAVFLTCVHAYKVKQ